MRFLLAICLWLVIAFVAAEKQGKIIIRKLVHAGSDYFAVGQNLTVSHEVINIGEGDAYEITITDKWPDEHFQTFGENEHTIAVFAAGERVTHNFTVLPATAGGLRIAGSAFSYKPTLDADPVNAKSSQQDNVQILSADEFRKLTSSFRMQWAFFGVACLLAVGVPFNNFLSLQAANQDGLPKKDE